MKALPISFSAPMVFAKNAGTKTQTRRTRSLKTINTAPDNFELVAVGRLECHGHRHDDKFGALFSQEHDGRETTIFIPSPFGEPGGQLWVREPTYRVEDEGWVGPVYVASEEGSAAIDHGYGESDDPDFIEPYDMKIRPAMFMRREYCRSTLEVVEIRVERLHDMSERDAIAEGVISLDNGLWAGFESAPKRATARAAYEDLWVLLNGKDSWALNPWLWVISFREVLAVPVGEGHVALTQLGHVHMAAIQTIGLSL